MYRTIVLAYDGSTEGRLALREGARLAQICGAEVVLLAVVDMTVGASMAGTAVPYAPPQDMDDYSTTSKKDSSVPPAAMWASWMRRPFQTLKVRRSRRSSGMSA